jgi:divalent metal cation (Fe/Co/Zn/Cd) transporter
MSASGTGPGSLNPTRFALEARSPGNHVGIAEDGCSWTGSGEHLSAISSILLVNTFYFRRPQSLATPCRRLDSEGTKPVSVEELYRQSRRAALYGLVISLGLGVTKLLGGWWGHSYALLSDAVHSLGDVVTLSVVWGALRFSQRPPDPEHPYGHTRLEAATGSNVALVLILSALGIIWESIHTMGQAYEEPATFTLAVRQQALTAPGVLGVEKLLVRKTGLEYLVDIHVEVDPGISVREGHAIAHAVKDRVVNHIVQVKDVLVHIEPAPTGTRPLQPTQSDGPR